MKALRELTWSDSKAEDIGENAGHAEIRHPANLSLQPQRPTESSEGTYTYLLPPNIPRTQKAKPSSIALGELRKVCYLQAQSNHEDNCPHCHEDVSSHQQWPPTSVVYNRVLHRATQ